MHLNPDPLHITNAPDLAVANKWLSSPDTSQAMCFLCEQSFPFIPRMATGGIDFSQMSFSRALSMTENRNSFGGEEVFAGFNIEVCRKIGQDACGKRCSATWANKRSFLGLSIKKCRLIQMKIFGGMIMQKEKHGMKISKSRLTGPLNWKKFTLKSSLKCTAWQMTLEQTPWQRSFPSFYRLFIPWQDSAEDNASLILERTLHWQLYQFLSEHLPLSPYHRGFQKNHYAVSHNILHRFDPTRNGPRTLDGSCIYWPTKSLWHCGSWNSD